MTNKLRPQPTEPDPAKPKSAKAKSIKSKPTEPKPTEAESTESSLDAAGKIETEAPSAGQVNAEFDAADQAEFAAKIEAAAEDELKAEEALEAAELIAAAEEDSAAQAAAELDAETDAEGDEQAGEEAEVEAESYQEAIDAAELEDGEEAEAEAVAETEVEAEDGPEPEEASEDDEEEAGVTAKPRPPAKLERLQKIMAQAGIASRRRAEELIEQGRVQVNGKVVTELGTKADGGRDHIRVDGKLLQGPERLRYFVLNKPKGFVTTAKDPEGRPTVMQFFDKMKERLYPVGRLDYMSEGLLVVTNDGELANRLTKASSGVEKTYLVKVAGQPTEGELDALRSGVTIERGKPGTPQVRTSPARIRQVRQGDNPWYEVVLIEGRNRELRKMFEEVGHFVEKIRRVGYGPLVLDQEPGNLRELETEEVEALRKAAEGKLRTPKSKELRRRNLLDSQLPTVEPRRTMHPRPATSFDAAGTSERASTPRASADSGPKKFGAKKPFDSKKSFETKKPFDKNKPFRSAAARSDDRPSGAAPARFGSGRPAGRPSAGPAKRPFRRDEGEGSFPPPASRPAWKKDSPSARPARFDSGSTGEDRPRPSASHEGPSGIGRSGGGRPFSAKPTWTKPERSERAPFKRPIPPRREVQDNDDDLGPVRPPNLQIEEISGPDRSGSERSSSARSSSNRSIRPSAPRPYSDRTSSSRPSSGRPSAPRSSSDRPSSYKPRTDRPSGGSSRESGPRDFGSRESSSGRPSSPRPFRSEGGLARPFTTSSGKPRAGGARPSSKPGRTSTRPYGSGSSTRSGSGPRSDSRPESRPSYGAKGSYDKSSGPAKRPFRRDEGGTSGARPARPYTPRAEGASDYRPTKDKPYPSSTPRAERKAGPGWKPKPSFGGPSKPKSGGYSKPGGGSGYKGKTSSSGPKRTGPRPGGKRPGGASGGKKRG
jgi:23S rRNA pseudouridine2605 synthase